MRAYAMRGKTKGRSADVWLRYVPGRCVRIRPTPRVPEALGSRQEAVLKYLLRNRGLPILVWKRKK